MEFTRFKCGLDDCELCGNIQDLRYPVIEPIPRPIPNCECRHYLTYEQTRSYKENGDPREPDDFQPRKQCQDYFNKGLFENGSPDLVSAFAKEYLVEESLVNDFLVHKKTLKSRKDSRLRQKGKDKESISVDPVTVDSDNDTNANEDEFHDDDVILNFVGESENEDDDTPGEVTFVPSLQSVTKHGNVTGNWHDIVQPVSDSSSSCSSSDDDHISSSESTDEDITHTIKPIASCAGETGKNIYVTRTGRKASTWKNLKDM